MGISTGTDGWPEKRQRSQPSVMRPLREGMSERTANVKPGPTPAPQSPRGRFRGTYALRPSCNWAERWCASAKYPPSTPGQQQSSSSEEEKEQYPGSAWLSEEGPGSISPKAGTTEASSSRARRRVRKSRTPSCYVLQGRTTAHVADDVGPWWPGKTWPSHWT